MSAHKRRRAWITDLAGGAAVLGGAVARFAGLLFIIGMSGAVGAAIAFAIAADAYRP